MSEENANQSFGKYLSAMRAQAGIDLEYVSHETKIGKDMLRAIEEENHEKLPSPVYVQGFIRAFSGVVGADGDWAVKAYGASRREFEGPRKKSDSIHNRRKSDFLPRFLLGAALSAFVLAAAYFGFFAYKKIFGEDDSVEKPVVMETAPEREVEKTEAADTRRPEPASEGPAESPGGAAEPSAAEKPEGGSALSDGPPAPQETVSQYELDIEAVAACWMKVIVDGKKSNEYNLKPGDKLSLSADSRFNLLIGNAGGVKLTLNETPVSVPGKSGQVVNLTLPKTNE